MDGMGGLGKTALAVHVGHRLRARYPDGQLFIDLAGTSNSPLDPAGAMTQVIRSFVPTAQLPDSLDALAPLYRSVLNGKRVLLVFDNAAESGQVAPLVPPSTCGVIVTSRRQVALPGAARVELDLMAPQEARALLQSIVGSDRAGEEVLDRIAALCGYLPLALRVAGSFLRINRLWPAEDYVAALSDERERLTRMALEGDPQLNVLASMVPSLQTLRQDHPQTADLWHRLGVFEGDFALDAAAAIWAVALSDARDQMQRLVTWAMVMADPQTARFQLHDLMRDLALGHVPDNAGIPLPGDLEASLSGARRMHAEHYADVLERANITFLEGGANVLSGLLLFDGERPNIEAGYGWAHDHRYIDAKAAWRCMTYPLAGANVLDLRQTAWERIDWLNVAVTAAREIGDRRGEGNALGNLGLAHAALGDARRAIEYHERALEVSREIGDRRGEGAALGNLGNAHADLGDARRAIEFYEQRIEIAREIGDRRGEGNALGNLGLAHADLGDARRAIEFYEQHLEIAREIGDRRSEGNALGNLGKAHLDFGDFRLAIEFLQQQLKSARQIGNRRGEGIALSNLGNAHSALGDARRAIEFYEQHLNIAREIGGGRGKVNTLVNLGLAHVHLGNMQQAIEFLEEALVVARKNSDRIGEANALSSLGNAHLNIGYARYALKLSEQSLDLSREICHRQLETKALLTLGRVHLKLGNARRAIELHGQHLEIAREIGDRRGEGNALGNLGVAHAALGEARRANELLSAAREIFAEIDAQHLVSQTDRLIAQLMEQT